MKPLHSNEQRGVVATDGQRTPECFLTRRGAAQIVFGPRFTRLRQVELGSNGWRTLRVKRPTTRRRTCGWDMARHNVPPVEKLERNFPGPRENVAEVGVTALRSTMPTNGKRANADSPLLRSQPFEITSLLAGVSFFTVYPHDRMQNTAKGVVGGEEDACRVSTLCASGLYSDGFDVGSRVRSTAPRVVARWLVVSERHPRKARIRQSVTSTRRMEASTWPRLMPDLTAPVVSTGMTLHRRW
jgi:hypothetical protein